MGTGRWLRVAGQPEVAADHLGHDRRRVPISDRVDAERGVVAASQATELLEERVAFVEPTHQCQDVRRKSDVDGRFDVVAAVEDLGGIRLDLPRDDH